MKKNIHPSYQKILFIDSASGHQFICGSTLKPDAEKEFEGEKYKVSYLSISSTSHPLYTGSKQLVDSEGRVEKFKKRFERKKEGQAAETLDLQVATQEAAVKPQKFENLSVKDQPSEKKSVKVSFEKKSGKTSSTDKNSGTKATATKKVETKKVEPKKPAPKKSK